MNERKPLPLVLSAALVAAGLLGAGWLAASGMVKLLHGLLQLMLHLGLQLLPGTA